MNKTQIAQMTGQSVAKVEAMPPRLYSIVEFGCQKALDAIPEGWSYEFNTVWNEHMFTHEDYSPADDDRDSENFIHGANFIMALNEVFEQEQEWQELFKGTKERLSNLTIRGSK
jgi:hypothetical protein